MERAATDVAQPPVAGGELPSFEELLAKGSFQARLARARVERARALAEAGTEGGDDLVLNSSRKPWERDKAAPMVADRLTAALEASATLGRDRAGSARSGVARPGDVQPEKGRAQARPLRAEEKPDLAPVRAPAPVYAPAPRGQGARALPAIVPAEPLARSRSRAAMVAGGFVSGLAIGIAATMILPRLPSAMQGPSTAVAPALAPSTPATLLAAAAFGDADAAGNIKVPGAFAPRPSSVVAPVLSKGYAAQTAPVMPGRAAGASTAGRIVAPAFGTALAYPAPPARIPAPGSGPSGLPLTAFGLATAARADLMPAPAAVAAVPSVDGGAGPISVAPLGTIPAEWVVAASFADPGMERVAVQPLPAIARVDAPLEVQPAYLPRFHAAIIFNVPESVADTELAGIVDGLGAAGFALGEPHRVAITVSQTNVRYFHAEDGQSAVALAEALGAVARDFTDFSPAPPVGTVELWIAGRAGAAASSGAQRNSPRGSSADQALIDLRNRILQQLRAGDHL